MSFVGLSLVVVGAGAAIVVIHYLDDNNKLAQHVEPLDASAAIALTSVTNKAQGSEKEARSQPISGEKFTSLKQVIESKGKVGVKVAHQQEDGTLTNEKAENSVGAAVLYEFDLILEDGTAHSLPAPCKAVQKLKLVRRGGQDAIEIETVARDDSLSTQRVNVNGEAASRIRSLPQPEIALKRADQEKGRDVSVEVSKPS